MKLSLLFLAAGKSSRLGRPKGLYPFGGRPWLEFQLAQAKSFSPLIVLGTDHAAYLEQWSGLQVAINEKPERGPFSSLQVGVAQLLKNDFDFVAVQPVDIPFFLPELNSLERSLVEAKGPKPEVVQLSYQNKVGHPVILSRAFCEAIVRLEPSTHRLDHEIRQLDQSLRRVISVESPWILENLNTPEGFKRFETMYRESVR